MSDFPIKHNPNFIPFSGKNKYPWHIEPGYEFEVPAEKEKSVRSAAYSRKKKGERWSVRRLSNGNVAVHRIK